MEGGEPNSEKREKNSVEGNDRPSLLPHSHTESSLQYNYYQGTEENKSQSKSSFFFSPLVSQQEASPAQIVNLSIVRDSHSNIEQELSYFPSVKGESIHSFIALGLLGHRGNHSFFSRNSKSFILTKNSASKCYSSGMLYEHQL